ncbi:MAG: glycogen debranching enzyme N-terminal domain-containing protein, partial [Desulfobacula sp.]|nr:glycogen debranching enzyme N-terminal domain-containing protein [Desulfobacula sp.]
WADLTKLDYSNIDLWTYMADVFLLWCHRGVDGFRCDAGYMIPVKAWEYIVAKVRKEYPDTLFFLEGLGGPLETTRGILSRANFNWAYSELFQNYTRQEISDYLPTAYDISDTCGHTIHFAETHDNNRLASVSTRYAKMRTSLCALFSVCGGFGFVNGVEWFATQKIDVHESTSLNWGNKTNQVDHISTLNRILTHHPTYFGQTRLSLIQQNPSECLVLLRHNEQQDKKLLVLINLDCETPNEASWLITDVNMKEILLYDLITGAKVKIDPVDGRGFVRLSPGEALALTPDFDSDDISGLDQNRQNQTPDRVYLQKLKSKVLAIHTALKGYGNISRLDVDQAAVSLARDPVEFIRSFNTESNESRVIVFDWEKDLKRQLMIPPGFFLLVKCPSGFRAEIFDEKTSVKTSLGYEEGIPTQDRKGFFALFFPKVLKRHHKEYTLRLRVFEIIGTRIEKTSLLYLAPFEALYMSSFFTRKEIVKTPFLKLLDTTKKGGMLRAAAWWGRLDSRYDAFLGANMDSTTPENRWMVLSRCRIWAVFQGYSRELAPDCLERFTFSYDHGGK